jgi:hypothetical protein
MSKTGRCVREERGPPRTYALRAVATLPRQSCALGWRLFFWGQRRNVSSRLCDLRGVAGLDESSYKMRFF